jgi:undecaprenyl diphosphate synthase
MGLLKRYLRMELQTLLKNNIRFKVIGRMEELPTDVQEELHAGIERTASSTGLLFNIALNYGGRAEIADAAAAIAREAAAGRLDPDKVDEKTVARHLDEPGIPDVDLFVRSSGEQRTSNFLLWQSAYAEMVFLDTLWPDFDRRHLWHAIETYASRDRRYGAAVPNEPRAESGAAVASPGEVGLRPVGDDGP